MSESDEERENADMDFMSAKYEKEAQEQREARKRRNGVLMSEDEAFLFFVRGPAGKLKDHSSMAHCVAKQQQYFCQRALEELLAEAKGRWHTNEEYLTGVRAGIQEALERIKVG